MYVYIYIYVCIYIYLTKYSHFYIDGEYMAGMLASQGYKIILEDAKKDDASVWVLNSCTVKGPSEMSFINDIRKGKNKGKKVVVAGCVPQGASASKNSSEWDGLSVIGVSSLVYVYLNLICLNRSSKSTELLKSLRKL